ncbi:flagellar hook-associated protein FlgK [Microvirga roseola]|uniref:flagellar hook-associated protein FlgK n=1 Tax=Microvirga roseola TaxID=2883126 RepID=UPI001E3DCB19|nr:flagellar hook-associated protein FlgK [Microvirga roseola]
MSLSLALNTARSSLQASQSQIAVVSRNTAGASEPSYSRKIASLVTQGGAARVFISRASDVALYTKMLDTTSNAATQNALLEGLKKLEQTVGDTELNHSPAALVGELKNALEQYAKSPDDVVMARKFLASASDMASALNKATSEVQAVRLEADGSIAKSVVRINDILVKFEKVNQDIMRGSAAGADITDNLDVRDQLIAQLSEEIGITVVPREGNDVAIYTDSGVPLFERMARPVTFTPTTVYGAGTVGNAVFIDGIQVTGAGAPMPLNSGNLVGLTQLRDDVAVTYQRQLDEIARGLIATFAESDQVGADIDRTGVFDYVGGPSVPLPPAPTGLAARIRINAAVDPAAGGSLDRIRDGGINGGDYRYNPGLPGTDAAYSDRLYGLREALDADRPFDPSLGLGSSASLVEFSGSSASWLQGFRQKVASDLDYGNTLLGHASTALSNATDVNMDEETALMLQLEKSYAASAKLISTINDMLKTLLNMV